MAARKSTGGLASAKAVAVLKVSVGQLPDPAPDGGGGGGGGAAEEDDEAYVFDAKHYGNLARFLNHSCDSNCFIATVVIPTHDLHVHRVAIFTHTTVAPMTELTYDYGYVVGTRGARSMKCYCGEQTCRKQLL
jgi:hypothetical protein